MSDLLPGKPTNDPRLANEIVIELAGEIDLATCPQLIELVDREIRACDGGLVVMDMARVTFVDSTGLALLVRAQRSVTANGGHVVVRSPSPQFRHLLAITGVDALVTVEPHEPERTRLSVQAGVLAGAMANPLTSLPPW
ncbi:MAG: STAS domain-containing protein [Acidimicrobiales bacterium]|nr:STAS domain-containing protein [Acidimicrobiales bacterium]